MTAAVDAAGKVPAKKMNGSPSWQRAALVALATICLGGAGWTFSFFASKVDQAAMAQSRHEQLVLGEIAKLRSEMLAVTQDIRAEQAAHAQLVGHVGMEERTTRADRAIDEFKVEVRGGFAELREELRALRQSIEARP